MPSRLDVAVDIVVDVLLVVGAVLTGLAWAPAPERLTTAAAGAPTEAALVADIERLAVAEPAADEPYDRAQFPHWIEITRDCDTRCVVLDRQRSPGGWLSAYDGYVATTPRDLEIDHVVPLAEAWISGASTWTLARRTAFANDLDGAELLAVSAWSNGDKSASDPASWRPPDPGWWCRYASAWVSVKLRWALTADRAEIRALDAMSSSC
jgi:hypothetical protein